MTFETYEYTIPTWAICPLEYGDYSGLNDCDIEALHQFEYSLPANGHFSWPKDIDSEKFFSYRHDINDCGYETIDIGSEVVKVVYLVPFGE